MLEGARKQSGRSRDDLEDAQRIPTVRESSVDYSATRDICVMQFTKLHQRELNIVSIIDTAYTLNALNSLTFLLLFTKM